jgi:PhnB protein
MAQEDPMAKTVKPIPEGYHTVTPYLICKGAAGAIEFYKKAFGAVETVRMPNPDGKIGHAEIKIGDSHIMLADENPELHALSPAHFGGTPVSILLYVDKVDSVFQQAVAAGAKTVEQPTDKFYGDRTSSVIDPFGHSWYIHTHVKDVSPEEMRQAMQGAQGAS